MRLIIQRIFVQHFEKQLFNVGAPSNVKNPKMQKIQYIFT